MKKCLLKVTVHLLPFTVRVQMAELTDLVESGSTLLVERLLDLGRVH